MGVDEQLPRGSSPHQHLRLPVGRPSAILRGESREVGQHAAVRQQLNAHVEEVSLSPKAGRRGAAVTCWPSNWGGSLQ